LIDLKVDGNELEILEAEEFGEDNIVSVVKVAAGETAESKKVAVAVDKKVVVVARELSGFGNPMIVLSVVGPAENCTHHEIEIDTKVVAAKEAVAEGITAYHKIVIETDVVDLLQFWVELVDTLAG
jgi:hypothetical protein